MRSLDQPFHWPKIVVLHTFDGEGNRNPLQCSCLENPMDRGAWLATVHGSQRIGHDWVTELNWTEWPHAWVFSRCSHVWLFVTLWTEARQASLSMGFSRQEHWNGLLFPSPGDLPNPGIKPTSPALQADSLPTEPPGKPKPGLRSIQTYYEVAIMSSWAMEHI